MDELLHFYLLIAAFVLASWEFRVGGEHGSVGHRVRCLSTPLGTLPFDPSVASDLWGSALAVARVLANLGEGRGRLGCKALWAHRPVRIQPTCG